MEDKERGDNGHNAGGDPPGSPAEIDKREQIRKTRSASQKTKNQQKIPDKSLSRGWKKLGTEKKIGLVFAGIVAFAAIGTLGAYIWGNLQTKWNFTAEHRPKVVIIRPPDLLGSVNCEVTEKAIYLHAGAMRFWVKNIRKGDAVGAFVAPEFKLVPEKKIGNPIFDDLPPITDETCKLQVSPKMKDFPINGGQEVSIDMVQGMEVQSLIRTNSISMTFGGPQKEPEPAVGEDPARVAIAKDAIFQLYAPVCVYYFSEDGERYGSCRSYRLAIKGRIGNPDNYGFSCTESPISGTLEATFMGYCEN